MGSIAYRLIAPKRKVARFCAGVLTFVRTSPGKRPAGLNLTDGYFVAFALKFRFDLYSTYVFQLFPFYTSTTIFQSSILGLDIVSQNPRFLRCKTYIAFSNNSFGEFQYVFANRHRGK